MTAPAFAGDARSQLRRLSVLIAANFVDMIGFAIVLPLLPFYALRLHATDFQVGLIIAAFSVAQLLSAPVWGRVSDRYGRRPALLIALASSAAAYVVFGLANGLWLLFASRLIQGAGGGTTGVAQAYVADTIRPADRARALGWLSAATSAGIMLGPVIGSFAYAHGGPAAPGYVGAALCLLNAAFAWRWLPESRVRTGDDSLRRPVWHGVWQVIRTPAQPVPQLIWIYAVGMLAFTCLTAVLALYLGAEFQVNAKTIGFFYTYLGGLSLIMRSLFLGPIVSRIGETWAMRSGTLVLITGLLTYPLAHSIWALVLVMPLVPIGTALLFPATTALMSRRADRRELGTVMGVAQTFGGLSRVAAPLIGTAAFQYHHDLPFYLAGAIVALVGILAFRVVPPTAVETPAAGTRAASG